MEVSKTIQNLNSEIGFEKCRLERIKIKYKRECGNFIKRLFSMDENYILKKETFQGKIANQKQIINNLEYRVSEVTALDFDLGMKFLATVISLVEGEAYSYRRLTIHEVNTNYQTGSPYDFLFSIINGEIGLIAKTEIIDKIKDNQFSNANHLASKLRRKNEKSIIVRTFSELGLFTDKEVPKNLVQDFPYLEGICTDIVRIKLSDPNTSEVEICSKYLRKLNNSKYLEDLKKQVKQKRKM